MWSLTVVMSASLCGLAWLRRAIHGFATPFDTTPCAVPVARTQPCRRPLR